MGKFSAPASSKSGEGFAIPDEGTHGGVLVAMIDLGTQEEPSFADRNVMTEIRRVFLVWELTSEQMPGSTNNFVVGNRYTLSGNVKATLRKIAEEMLGKSYSDDEQIDFDTMLGRPCCVTVTHTQGTNGRKYVQVGNITRPAKGLKIEPAKRPQLAWGLDDPIEQLEKCEWLPYSFGQKLSEVVKRSVEWCEALGERPTREAQSARPVRQAPASRVKADTSTSPVDDSDGEDNEEVPF